MFARSWASVVVILVTGAANLRAAEAVFRRIDGQPTDVSVDGSILIASTSYQISHSYLIRPDGTSLEIDALPDDFFGATTAVSLSNDGTIVAGSAGSRSQFGFAWIKKPDEDFHRLGSFGGDRSFVRGMSANGQVVVGIASDSEQHYHGFRWTEETGMTAVDGIPNALESLVYGVSSDGRVILGGSTFLCPECDPGYIDYDDDCNGVCPPPIARYHETFLWTSETGAVSIGRPLAPNTAPNASGKLETPQSVNAHAMSDDGSTIVGTTSGPNGSFVWRAETGFLPLPNLQRFGHSFYPSDVSADGNLVVGLVAGAGAVVWTPQRGTQLLETVLADEYGLGEEMSNAFLERATFVSADGRTIAGIDGDDRWWIVNLAHSISAPEPTTIQLLLASIFVSTMTARRHRGCRSLPKSETVT